MSEADKILEKLRFEKSEIENVCIKYTKYNLFSKEIYFHLKQKKVGLDGVFSMQELQAINKKVEELRMDIEEQWREKTLKDIQEGKVIVAYAEKDKDGNTIVRLYTEDMLERC